MTIRAILTDIEGTTSSIHFVHQVLFPYAAKALPEFLRASPQPPEVADILQALQVELALPSLDLTAIEAQLQEWIRVDLKHPLLKALQGLIWRAGYESGAYQAHLYPEVAGCLRDWYSKYLLYVYSSGSIQAQKLFFGYSVDGDLSPYFRGYFDTGSGGKREVASYRYIARQIGLIPGEILFLSDIPEELDAAAAAGMRTTLLQREAEVASTHPRAQHFNEIKL